MNIGIVGGGASGMFLASMLKKNKNVNVTLIERNSRLGKKLLLTGNGKCNFTNDDYSTNVKNIYNSDFAYNIYCAHDKDDFLSFMRNIGIEPKVEIHKGEKYYYPNSNKSLSVYYALLDKIIDNGVKILYDTFVKDIKKSDDGFIVVTNDSSLHFDSIIIASGGNTYKNTGSDGNIYKVLEKLGHTIVKPLPALCGFSYNDKDLLSLKGVRVDASIKALVYDMGGSKTEFIEKGEIQFTQNGVSGIPVMNLSRLVNRYIDENKKVDLIIDFAYIIDEKKISLISYLSERKEKLYYKDSKNFLCGFIPDEIAYIIIKRCGIKDKLVSKLSDSELERVACEISNFKIADIKTPSIDNAQITIGGVNLKEVDNVTLESKIIREMYLIGEVLDVDGKCGGYNLQFAYSSAATVAKTFDFIKVET